MEEEILVIQKNDTWELTTLPPKPKGYWCQVGAQNQMYCRR